MRGVSHLYTHFIHVCAFCFLSPRAHISTDMEAKEVAMFKGKRRIGSQCFKRGRRVKKRRQFLLQKLEKSQTTGERQGHGSTAVCCHAHACLCQGWCDTV